MFQIYNQKGNFANLISQEEQKNKSQTNNQDFSLQYKSEKQENTPQSTKSSAYPQSQFVAQFTSQKSKEPTPKCGNIPLGSNSISDSENEQQQPNALTNKSQTNNNQQQNNQNIEIIQKQYEEDKNALINLLTKDNNNNELTHENITPNKKEENIEDELEMINKLLERKKELKKATIIQQAVQATGIINEDKGDMINSIQAEKVNEIQLQQKQEQEQQKQTTNNTEIENDVFSKEPDFNLVSPSMKSVSPPPIFSMEPQQQKQNMNLSFNEINNQNSAENINSKRNINEQFKDKSISQIVHNQSEDFSQLGIENDLLNQQVSQNQFQEIDDNISNFNNTSTPFKNNTPPIESAGNSIKKDPKSLKNIIQSRVISQIKQPTSYSSTASKSISNSATTKKTEVKPTLNKSLSTQKSTTLSSATSATPQPKVSSYLAKKQQLSATSKVSTDSKAVTEPAKSNTLSVQSSKLKSQQSLNVGSSSNLNNKSLLGSKSNISATNISNNDIKQSSYSQIKANQSSVSKTNTSNLNNSTTTKPSTTGLTKSVVKSSTTQLKSTTSNANSTKVDSATKSTNPVAVKSTTLTKQSSYMQQAASKQKAN